MANGFTVNAHRYDPYKNFKFRVKDEDGATVLGVSKVSSLKRTTEVVTHREGGEDSYQHKSPGRSNYDAITLERGVTHDEKFAEWAKSVHSFDGDAAMDLVNYKRELTLEVMNERGQVAIRYFLHGCWVSEYSIADLDANANAVLIESLKLEIEGWERDSQTTEPNEAAAVPASS